MLSLIHIFHWASMEKLLQEGDYSRQKKKKSNVTGAISTVYWLIVVAGYLAVSFIAEDWNNSWIIWPVAALIYAAIMVVCNALSGKNQ